MHRTNLTLYDLRPKIQDTAYISPNSSVIGDTAISAGANIWGNCVIRGDLNSIAIGTKVVVGENTVISTVSALPTGLPAFAFICEFRIFMIMQFPISSSFFL